MFGWFHPKLAGYDERGEKRGAETKDATDTDVLRKDAGENQAEDLRGKDGGHQRGADAAHEFGRRLLLNERL